MVAVTSFGWQLLLEWVEVEPISSSLALGRHEDVEVIEDFRIFGQKLEPVIVNFQAGLEPGVEIVYGILVLRFG